MLVPENLRLVVACPDDVPMPERLTDEQMTGLVEAYEARLRYRAVVYLLATQLVLILTFLNCIEPAPDLAPRLVSVALLVGSLAQAARLGLESYVARKRRDRLFDES